MGETPLGALVPNGLSDATTDEATIRRWWATWPDADPAVRTGPASKLVIVDADGTAGADTLAELQAKYGALPDGPIALTPRGAHHYLAYPSDRRIGSSAGQLGDGLDVRAEGGYALLPPSANGHGQYEWDALYHPKDVPIPPTPPWLAELAEKVSSADGDRGFDPLGVLAGVPEGQRNDAVFRYAASLRARNVRQAEAKLLVLEAAANCYPPMEPAEALRCLASVYDRYVAGTSNGAAYQDGTARAAAEDRYVCFVRFARIACALERLSRRSPRSPAGSSPAGRSRASGWPRRPHAAASPGPAASLSPACRGRALPSAAGAGRAPLSATAAGFPLCPATT